MWSDLNDVRGLQSCELDMSPTMRVGVLYFIIQDYRMSCWLYWLLKCCSPATMNSLHQTIWSIPHNIQENRNREISNWKVEKGLIARIDWSTDAISPLRIKRTISVEFVSMDDILKLILLSRLLCLTLWWVMIQRSFTFHGISKTNKTVKNIKTAKCSREKFNQ